MIRRQRTPTILSMIKKLDKCTGSLCYANKKLQNIDAPCLASEGSKDLSDDRIKTMHFVANMNYNILEHTNREDGRNVLHDVTRRNSVS